MNKPKSLENIDESDFELNSKGAITIRFHPQKIHIKFGGKRFTIEEGPAVVVFGAKKNVLGIY